MNVYEDHGWFEVKPSQSSQIEFPDYLDYARERFNFANDDPTWRGYLNPDQNLRVILADVVRNVPQAYSYTPSIGIKDAREAFHKLIGAPDSVKWEHSFLMIGRELAISIAARSICNPGDKILVPNPCDPFINLICARYNFTAIEYRIKLEESSIDIEHLTSQLTANPDTKFIFLMNPLVPTGTIFGKAALEALFEVSKKFGVVVICDESWRDWTSEQRPPTVFEIAPDAPKAVIADLGIKLAAPGLRMGGIAFQDSQGIFEEIMPGVQTLSQVLIHPSSLVQGAMSRFAKELDHDYVPKNLMAKVNDNKAIVEEALGGKVKFLPSEGTHFICFRLPASFQGSATALCEVIQAKTKAKLVPGRFFTGKNGNDDFIRLELSGDGNVYRDLAKDLATVI